jgi:hypothetical protein
MLSFFPGSLVKRFLDFRLDSRRTSSGSMRMDLCPTLLLWPIKCKRKLAAFFPISVRFWSTVLKGTRRYSPYRWLPMPIIPISCGTEHPTLNAAWSAPIAIGSLAQKTASGLCFKLKSLFIAKTASCSAPTRPRVWVPFRRSRQLVSKTH